MTTNATLEILQTHQRAARDWEQCFERIISAADANDRHAIKLALARNRESSLRLARARITYEAIATLIPIMDDEPEGYITHRN